MQTIEQALQKLQTSSFRSSFQLSAAEKCYVREKGLDVIKRHAEDFIENRLAPANPKNDGHQTPMRGHPVFVAQHATACCCRSCLNKWYRVPMGVALSQVQQEKIVALLLTWIKYQMEDTISPGV